MPDEQTSPAPKKLPDGLPVDLSILPEISYSYLRASGPGGQHVNSTDSAVQLRFSINVTNLLDKYGKERLRQLARRQINAQDELIITAHEYRSQIQNKQSALLRLRQRLLQASKPPKPRRKTKVPNRSKKKRLESKRHLAEKKRLRSSE